MQLNYSNPTKAEIDEWYRIAINHIFALEDYTYENRKIKKIAVCLYNPFRHKANLQTNGTQNNPVVLIQFLVYA
jgi:hypothetical protein